MMCVFLCVWIFVSLTKQGHHIQTVIGSVRVHLADMRQEQHMNG